MPSKEIKVSGGMQLGLKFQERSTIIVITGGQKKPQEVLPQHLIEPAIKPETIFAVIQDCLEHGVEDAQSNGSFDRFRIEVEEARNSGTEFSNIQELIDTNLAELRFKVEGSKMGFPSGRLSEVRGSLVETAEEVWTEPQKKTA